MRVLFTCLPAYGHFQPMAPLAQALTRCGHEVLVATGPDFCARVERSGFKATPVGPTREEGAELARPGASGLTGDGRQRRLWDNYTFIHGFAGVAARLRAADLEPLVSDWRPDVVVHDITDFAAPCAAVLAGVPHMLHSWGPRFPELLMERAGTKAAPLWEEAGLRVPRAGGMYDGLYIDVCPPCIQAADGGDVGTVLPLRPETFTAPADTGLAEQLNRLADAPHDKTAHVAFGTVANRAPALFHTVLAGLLDLDVNVVVTVGPDNDPSMVGPHDERVIVASYLPIGFVLPRCDIVVGHGGAGTMLAALSNGLPQLLLPQDADNTRNARLCVHAGVAIALAKPDLTVAGVREGVRSLLDDSHYGDAARRAQQEIAAMPPAESLAADFESLVATPVTR